MCRKKITVSVVGEFDPDYDPGHPGKAKQERPPLRARNNPDLPGQVPREGEDGQPGPSESEYCVSEFQIACRAIGKALAQSGHRILLCVPDWNAYIDTGKKHKGVVVAESVAAGAKEAWHWPWSGSEITLYRSTEPVPDCLVRDEPKIIPCAVNRPGTLPGVKLIQKFLPSSGAHFYPQSFPSVKDADAIIMLSGAQIHEFVACVAHHVQGEPVVAIPSFGGAAKWLYEDLLREHYESLAASDPQIRDELSALEGAWNADSSARASRIVRLTERLHDASKRQKERERRYWSCLAQICIGVFLVWVFLFVWLGVAGELAGKAPQTTDFWANVLLWLPPFLSAALGMMLRTIFAYRSAKITRLEPTALAIDIAAAILLAMGFCLIYLIGGWSFEGKAVPLELGKQTALIIAGLSLIGLAAGLLLPIEELGARLGRYLQLDESDKPT